MECKSIKIFDMANFILKIFGISVLSSQVPINYFYFSGKFSAISLTEALLE